MKKSLAGFIPRLVLIVVLATVVGLGWDVYRALATLPGMDGSPMQAAATTQIYDKNGDLLAVLGSSNYKIWVPLAQMPPSLIQAVLATEDVRFYVDGSVDLRSLARSAWYDISHLSLAQGGSTITEQLANNLYLDNNHQASLTRKIQEVVLGLELGHSYTKDEIMAMYLNKIYFGSGAYGIGEAAQTYFGVSPGQLTLAQAALLAGLPQAPSAYSPLTEPKAALARRNQVLANMWHYGFISAAQYRQAQAAGLELNPNLNLGYSRYPYATDYVLQQLGGIIGTDRVYRGGLKVYTTIDPTVQQAVQDALANPDNFPRSTRDQSGVLQPEGAAVFIDQYTGGIAAIAGGREHKTALPLDRAVESYRQPGSTIKPFLDYGPAIEYAGMTPDTVVQDAPLTIGNYSPQDDTHTYQGPVTLRWALTDSINVVAVKLLDTVGIPQAVQFAAQCGIQVPNAEEDGLAIALGGMAQGVTPLEMAGGYAAIANGGVYIEPHVIQQVVTDSGASVYTASPATRTAMQPYTDWALTSMLQSVVDGGTGTGAAIPGWAVAGKTGTTTGGKDLWFDGFTPTLTGVVWIGYDSPRPMSNGWGGVYAARAWRQIMTESLAGQIPQDYFPMPAGGMAFPGQSPETGDQGAGGAPPTNTDMGQAAGPPTTMVPAGGGKSAANNG